MHSITSPPASETPQLGGIHYLATLTATSTPLSVPGRSCSTSETKTTVAEPKTLRLARRRFYLIRPDLATLPGERSHFSETPKASPTRPMETTRSIPTRLATTMPPSVLARFKATLPG